MKYVMIILVLIGIMGCGGSKREAMANLVKSCDVPVKFKVVTNDLYTNITFTCDALSVNE